MPYLTQRCTRRRTNILILIPQGLDEVWHRLPIPYLTQRPTRRRTNTAIVISQGLDDNEHGWFSYRAPHLY
jgi:hypothetical protein